MRRVLAAGVLGTMAIVGIFVLRGTGSDVRPGPIHGPLGSTLAQLLKVGDIFSVGSVDLENEGQHSGRVERIRLLGVTGPMEFLGVRTRREPDPAGDFLGFPGFPPPEYPAVPLQQDPIVPVPTERTEAGSPLQRLQLLIGVRVTGPGVARYRAVEVTYTMRGRRYRRVMRNAAYLCATTAPEINPADPCPTKETEGKFDDRVVDVTDMLKT